MFTAVATSILSWLSAILADRASCRVCMFWQRSSVHELHWSTAQEGPEQHFQERHPHSQWGHDPHQPCICNREGKRGATHPSNLSVYTPARMAEGALSVLSCCSARSWHGWQVLRDTLGCRLPVEIVYNGNWEMDDKSCAKFQVSRKRAYHKGARHACAVTAQHMAPHSRQSPEGVLLPAAGGLQGC
jgi:hypothetical protein